MYRTRPGVSLGVESYRTVDEKLRLPGGRLCSLSDHMWTEAQLDIVKH